MSLNIDQITEVLCSLSVTELAEVSKRLEAKWGISSSSFNSQPAPAELSNSGAVEEKNSFDAILLSPGDNKINAIKEVRAITGLGLKEAKDLVDSTPKTLKTGINKSDAEEIKRKLESIGAKVDLK